MKAAKPPDKYAFDLKVRDELNLLLNVNHAVGPEALEIQRRLRRNLCSALT